MWRGQHQCPAAVELLDPFARRLATALAEHDMGGAALIVERPAHGRAPFLDRAITNVRPVFQPLPSHSKSTTSSGLTPKIASWARCGSPASKMCVVIGSKPGALTMKCRCAGR